MKMSIPPIALAAVLACSAAAAFAEDAAAPAPSGGTIVYRQVTSDGRIIYSDKPIKGGKIDHTITVEPPIKGNLWTSESGARPVVPPQIERTQINKIPSPPASGPKKTYDEAVTDVIRAEMQLEDAKRRLEAGVEPKAGERTGTATGGSRLNETYDARQKWLARDVAEAEALLKKAIKERDALSGTR